MSNAKQGNNKFTLELKFDAAQVTKALNYKFYSEEGSIFQEDGLCAGCFHFGDGGKMDIIVIGIADESDDMRFKINDLTITSLSTMNAGSIELSPFDKKRACISINKWEDFEQKGEKEVIIVTKAKKPLSIPLSNGQWSMSGFLSVEIEKRNGENKKVKQTRLFYFDPESTTGYGGGYPD